MDATFHAFCSLASHLLPNTRPGELFRSLGQAPAHTDPAQPGEKQPQDWGPRSRLWTEERLRTEGTRSEGLTVPRETASPGLKEVTRMRNMLVVRRGMWVCFFVLSRCCVFQTYLTSTNFRVGGNTFIQRDLRFIQMQLLLDAIRSQVPRARDGTGVPAARPRQAPPGSESVP